MLFINLSVEDAHKNLGLILQDSKTRIFNNHCCILLQNCFNDIFIITIIKRFVKIFLIAIYNLYEINLL